MTEVVEGLHGVSVHILDPPRARTFYREALGLREVSFDERRGRIVFALPGTSVLLTMHVMAPGEEGRPAGTVSGIAFHSADPTAACAEFRRRGGTVTVEPTVVEVDGIRFERAVIADPDGNEFLLTNRRD